MLVMQVCSSKLGTNASIFPIHYLHGWLGKYFDSHFLSPSWNHYPQMTYYVGKFSAKFFEDSQVWTLITSYKYVKLNHLTSKQQGPKFSCIKDLLSIQNLSQSSRMQITSESSIVSNDSTCGKVVMRGMVFNRIIYEVFRILSFEEVPSRS